MNTIERALNDELSRLIDRLADSVPGGCLDAVSARTPTLKTRLDEAEAQMAAVRASLLEGYARWRRTLDDVENLWALAAWRSAEVDPTMAPASPESGSVTQQAAQQPPPLAA